MYIRILAALGLADIRKVAPKLKKAPAKSAPDLATLQAIITHRYHVATAYARTLKTACAAELAALRARAHKDDAIDLPSVGRVKRWLTTDPAGWSPIDREHMESTVAKSQTLAKIVAMRSELAALWERSTESSEQLLARLQDWCHRAESSGIPPLAQCALQALVVVLQRIEPRGEAGIAAAAQQHGDLQGQQHQREHDEDDEQGFAGRHGRVSCGTVRASVRTVVAAPATSHRIRRTGA